MKSALTLGEAPVMPALEKRGLIEDVLAILERSPGLVVERVGYHVPDPVLVRQNADESIDTIQVDSVCGNPAAAVGAPAKANAAELSVR